MADSLMLGDALAPTHLVDESARSCQHLLDVLSGRASLVNLEVARPTSHALRVLPQVFSYTNESEGNRASDEDACRQQARCHAQRSLLLHARSRPWVRRLPVRGRRCRNTKHAAYGIFEHMCSSWMAIVDYLKVYAATLPFLQRVRVLATSIRMTCPSLIHLTRNIQRQDGSSSPMTHHQTASTPQEPWPPHYVLTGPLQHHSPAVYGPKSRGNKDGKIGCKGFLRVLSFLNLIGMNRAVRVLGRGLGIFTHHTLESVTAWNSFLVSL